LWLFLLLWVVVFVVLVVVVIVVVIVIVVVVIVVVVFVVFVVVVIGVVIVIVVVFDVNKFVFQVIPIEPGYFLKPMVSEKKEGFLKLGFRSKIFDAELNSEGTSFNVWGNGACLSFPVPKAKTSRRQKIESLVRKYTSVEITLTKYFSLLSV